MKTNNVTKLENVIDHIIHHCYLASYLLYKPVNWYTCLVASDISYLKVVFIFRIIFILQWDHTTYLFWNQTPSCCVFVGSMQLIINQFYFLYESGLVWVNYWIFNCSIPPKYSLEVIKINVTLGQMSLSAILWETSNKSLLKKAKSLPLFYKMKVT